MKNFSEVVDLCLRNEIRIETLINGNEFLHWMDRSGNGQIEENFHACKSKFGYCYILRNSNSTPVRQPVTWITTTAISTRNSRSKPASTLFIPLPKKF